MKVLHIIVGLNVGGAEMTVKRLVEHSPTSSQNSAVISLTTVGDIGRVLQAHGIQVHALNMSSFWHVPLGLWRLIRLIRQFNPAIVQTWMYHAELLGGLAARLAGNYPIVWNLRSNLIPSNPFCIPFWLIRLCAITSRVIPAHIICCASSAKATHVRMGYPEGKITVIPNGYDFSQLEKNDATRTMARSELGLEATELVIGAVGRFDPLKDFQTFISAAAQVAAICKTVKFLMVGRDNDWQNTTLRNWIEQAGMQDKFILVGQQVHVPYYLNAMDVFCLPSKSEAFPNVLVEAMAISLPCVTTHAGDAAEILGDNHFVVPTKTPTALAAELLKMCHLDAQTRGALGEANAKTVRIKYPIEKFALSYQKIYIELCNFKNIK
jgi:glycosyltransferase involved in cell wall biosynthesis